MAKIKESGILGKETKYWSDPIPANQCDRNAWLNGALKRVSGCDVVFLDPDKGLHSAQSMSDETKISTEHAYLDEVIKAEKRAKVVVLYHSFDHNTSHCEQIKEKITLLKSKFRDCQEVFAVRWNTSRPRAFLITCKAGQSSLVRTRLETMVKIWGKGHSNGCHFTLYHQ